MTWACCEVAAACDGDFDSAAADEVFSSAAVPVAAP